MRPAALETVGSLPTFAALANEISVKPEGERRHCGTLQTLQMRAGYWSGAFNDCTRKVKSARQNL